MCCKTGWRLVLAGGRFTTAAEGRYSATEGECLAGVVSLEQSKFYTMGCKELYMATDHKPILGILCDRALDTLDNPRLVALKERTLWWRFKLVYVEGTKQQAADALSRRRVTARVAQIKATLCPEKIEQQLEDSVGCNMVVLETAMIESVCVGTVQVGLLSAGPAVITWNDIREACMEDSVMTILVEQIERGFPDSPHEVPRCIQEYHKFRHGLSIVDSVPVYKTRIIIPGCLRQRVLGSIHSAHQGVSGMSARAEQSVFWPGMATQIISTRAGCRECNKIAPSQPAAPPV